VGIIPIDGVWNLVTLGICALLCFGALFRAHIRRSLGIGSSRILIFSMSWFIISLFPTLGIIGNFGVEAHADRFAYLPMMAISFLLMRMPLSTTVKMLIIAGILSLSWIQTGYWKDDATAYARALECDESHPRAMVHVADFKCSRRRDFDRGIELYKKALELEGSVPKGGFNVSDVRARLAYALVSRGRYNDYREVISLGGEVLKDFSLDRRGMMLDALGTALMQEGDFKLAARLFQASLDPPDRFWPKASTRQKLESCIKNRR
jgi:tetratricopeptide (TPR) repeat protein